MGATLALAAFSAAAAHGLDANPRAALVRMALSALDDAKSPRYWAGWEPLAEAIGYVLPSGDADDPEASRARRNAQEAVRLSVRALRAAELIKVARRAAPGRNAEYALHLPMDNCASPQIEPGAMVEQRPWLIPANAPGSSRQTPRTDTGAEEDRGDTEEETRASAPRSDSRCSRHRGIAEPPACRGCRDARLASDASAAAEAEAERERRSVALQTLDPAAVETLSRRIGGSHAAIIEAARAEMPGNLPLGLFLLDRRDDAAEAVARWER